MAHMKRARLSGVEVLPDFKLKLTFINGEVYTLDFLPLFDESMGLNLLRNPENFAGAQIIEGEGWTVEWPALDIQIGADTLWLDAQAQNAPDENTRFFAQWRARNGFSLAKAAKAAKALGITPRTMNFYGTVDRPVPRYIALACKGWELEH